MRNLPKPSRDNDEVDLKKVIRRYRYRGETRGHDIADDEIDAVLALYDLYEDTCGAPDDELKGEGMPQALCEAIHAAYGKTYEGRELYSLRELLLKGVDLCPVCGIDPPTELDHYLPKSEFKPLAIHARNLVPTCHSCNHAKLAGFGEGAAAFLHAYYDILPDIDFLHAAVEIDNGALMVSFAIDTAAALPAGYGERLARQMQVLNLAARYQQEVNAYISAHAASLHVAYRAAGRQGVRSTLRLQTRFETQAFHRNHWRPALLRALANHKAFTDGGFAQVLPISEEMLEDIESA